MPLRMDIKVRRGLGRTRSGTTQGVAAATRCACVEGTSALWVALVGSSNCRLSRVLGLQRKLSARSDRVKCVDLHPKEPWMLASLYNGNVHVWNHETQVRGWWSTGGRGVTHVIVCLSTDAGQVL